jgi:hypothetical protein
MLFKSGLSIVELLYLNQDEVDETDEEYVLSRE